MQYFKNYQKKFSISNLEFEKSLLIVFVVSVFNNDSVEAVFSNNSEQYTLSQC